MSYYDKHVEFSSLLGKVFTSITGETGGPEMRFITQEGEEYLFYHAQDCCEHVSIDDIAGDLSDLLGSPILLAEESSSGDNPEGVKPEYQDDSFTWTFYKLATIKGYVTIRWYGESNGYYSESVDLAKLA